jgi:hypothetical protein
VAAIRLPPKKILPSIAISVATAATGPPHDRHCHAVSLGKVGSFFHYYGLIFRDHEKNSFPNPARKFIGICF